MSEVSLRELTGSLGGELIGDGTRLIDRIGTLEHATPSTISFLSNPRYRSQLDASMAGCVIVAPVWRDAAVARGDTIVSADPYLYFARLTRWWVARNRSGEKAAVHPSALVSGWAGVADDASVGPFVVIEAGAVVGRGAVIGAHCVVGANAVIGDGTRLAPRVTVGAGCSIGARCIVHSGAVIGADGFGFAPFEGRWEKIEQLGAVRIGDDVEIGANTCIDRGALEDTVIANGVKLDNLIQIAHNVHIGEHTAVAAGTGIAGSTVIGAHCTIGGNAGIAGHVTLGDHVHISGAASVTRSISAAGHYSGVFPIDDHAAWEKNAATLRRLHALRDRVVALEKNASESNPP